MLTIKFADEKTVKALDSTVVYPSASSTVRSKMELHLAENAMALSTFEKLLKDQDKTKEITFIQTNDDGEVVYQTTYLHYIVLQSVGKELEEVVDHTTGEARKEMHLVGRLEQLTPTEQQLYKLGIEVL